MTRPAQAGTLGEWSIARLLAYALRTRHEGELRLTERLPPPAPVHVVLFAQGGVVGLETPMPLPSVGRMLVDLGALEEETYWKTARALGGDDDIYAQDLVAAGAITSAQRLQARAERVVRGVLQLAEKLASGTSFVLAEGDARARAEVPPIDPLPIVRDAIALRGLDGATEQALERMRGDDVIAIAPGAPIARLRLDADEERALSSLARRPVPMRELERVAPLGADRWRALLGLLLVIGAISDRFVA